MYFTVYLLLESNPGVWIHVTGICGQCVDNAGFHAIGPIWGELTNNQSSLQKKIKNAHDAKSVNHQKQPSYQ